MSMTQHDCDELGAMCSWDLVDTHDGERHVFTGTLLGAASSHRQHHTHGSGRACGACRWFEVKIVREVEDGDRAEEPSWGGYVVAYEGHTSIAGEYLRRTVHRTRSAHTVIELLTQHRDGGNPFIPRTSRIALSEAAGRDKGMEAAWIDRAVT